MERTMSISKARGQLPAIIEEVAAGLEVTLTRHGQPVAVIVHPDRLRDRRAADLVEGTIQLRDRFERASQEPLDRSGQLDHLWADARVEELRSDRSDR